MRTLILALLLVFNGLSQTNINITATKTGLNIKNNGCKYSLFYSTDLKTWHKYLNGGFTADNLPMAKFPHFKTNHTKIFFYARKD